MAFTSRKGCVLLSIGLLLVVGWFGYRLIFSTEPADTRFSGAYRFEDGRLGFVAPREGRSLRYREMSGTSRALWPSEDKKFVSGPGWSGREPVEVQVEFELDEAGQSATGMTWRTESGATTASRIELPEIFTRFASGDLTLRGKLVLPVGEAPFPAVVFVHGSERFSAVEHYFLPYLFAAHGIAGFVYDKRGTGESTGKYNQNFDLLSDDVVAAVDWLRQRPEIQPDNIHLGGYSQGGWIAPLAASKSEGVRSLLINYGPMVPVTGEDRWGYVWALQQKGFGDDAISGADEINDIVGAIMDRREDRWKELADALDRAQEEDWFAALSDSDSMVGFLASTRMPMWMLRIVAWWYSRGEVPFIDRLYDPVPTVAALEIPSLWLFGGEDSSMPTQWSVDELEKLQAAGRPVEYEVYPRAEHGILLMEEGKNGERDPIGYAPGYFKRQINWVRQQSGLAPIDSVAVGFCASRHAEI